MQVYIDSPLILNGVCLRWKGYINLEKLDGVGGMKYDEDSARVKDHILLKSTSYYPLPKKTQYAKNICNMKHNMISEFSFLILFIQFKQIF